MLKKLGQTECAALAWLLQNLLLIRLGLRLATVQIELLTKRTGL